MDVNAKPRTGTPPGPGAPAAVPGHDAAATPAPGGALWRHAEPLRRAWARVPSDWAYVLVLFVTAKVVLTLVGLFALQAFERFLPADGEANRDQLSLPNPLSMWFAWDSYEYERRAESPLSQKPRHFAFPLLYPYFSRGVSLLLGGHVGLALLLVSNVAFLFLLYYALKLGERLLDDPAAARRFTRYVVLLPTAFLFQAALTESIFVCLALAAFYHAERGDWIRVGMIGYVLALSRSLGFLVAVPLGLLLLQQRGYRLRWPDLGYYLRFGWPLLMLPAGWLTFMAFGRWRTGDWFVYKNEQEKGWSIRMQNPFGTLEHGLLSAETADSSRAWFAVVMLALIAVSAWRYVKPPYVAYSLIMVLMPLSIGPPVYDSVLRYLVVLFPLALMFAQWTKRATVDLTLTAAFAVLQGALFLSWLAYWTTFIV